MTIQEICDNHIALSIQHNYAREMDYSDGPIEEIVAYLTPLSTSNEVDNELHYHRFHGELNGSAWHINVCLE
jgi:hypothetical protein